MPARSKKRSNPFTTDSAAYEKKRQKLYEGRDIDDSGELPPLPSEQRPEDEPKGPTEDKLKRHSKITNEARDAKFKMEQEIDPIIEQLWLLKKSLEPGKFGERGIKTEVSEARIEQFPEIVSSIKDLKDRIAKVSEYVPSPHHLKGRQRDVDSKQCCCSKELV